MNIGIMGNALFPDASEGFVTGYSVAVKNLLNSFFQYSSEHNFTCLYEPGRYEYDYISSTRSKLSPERQQQIRLVDEHEMLFHGLSPLRGLDVLHSLRGDALSCLALRETLKMPIPITITLHGISEQRLLMDTFYPMLTFPFRSYDAILCTSESVRKTIANMFERLASDHCDHCALPRIRLEKVPLGINTDYFRPMEQQEVRSLFDLPPDAFVILWMGRFSIAHKADLRPLLQVFQRLIHRNPDRKLILVLAGCSSSASSDQLDFQTFAEKAGIRDHIRILQNNEIPDRAALYNACDVFTSPIDNIQETFGLTPVEAMACGVPQVVSDWDGYRDTVVDGQTGYLIPTAWSSCLDDLRECSFLPLGGPQRSELHSRLISRSIVVDCDVYEEKLQKLIDCPALLQEMKIQSRQRARTYYDNQTAVSMTEQVWKELRSRALAEGKNSTFRNLNILDYCHDFTAYPSAILTEHSEFVLSEKPSYMVWDSRDYITRTMEEHSLPEKLFKRLQPGVKYSAEILYKMVPQYNRSQIKRSLMYLYKNGLLRLYR